MFHAADFKITARVGTTASNGKRGTPPVGGELLEAGDQRADERHRVCVAPAAQTRDHCHKCGAGPDGPQLVLFITIPSD